MPDLKPSTKAGLSDALLNAFRDVVGERHLRQGEDVADIDPGWHKQNLDCGVVVSPASTNEVAAIVRLCAKHQVSIVPLGGKTGLVGGGISHAGQIVLSLDRMAQIDRLDPDERVVVAGAGLTLQSLQDAAAEFQLEPGIDIAARGSATIGGMISTNAGGLSAFRYGVMRHRVLGLEAVLPDGSIYSDLTRVVKNSAGYDLKHLFIGAEGTLGIVTRAALKLEPTAPAEATALFGLPSMAAIFHLIAAALKLSTGRLNAAEAMWPQFFDLSTTTHNWRAADFGMNHHVYLLVSLTGPDEATLTQELATLFETLLDAHPMSEALLASSANQRRQLWQLREDTDQFYRKHPAAPSYDVSVPVSEIEAYLDRLIPDLADIEPDLSPYVFGHIADGNLHIILNREADQLSREKLAKVEASIYKDIQALGGSFSAEHGVGSKRIHSLYQTADAVKLKLMEQVKHLLDPENLMNPNKVLR